MSIGAIVGTAFHAGGLEGEPVEVATPFGPTTLHRHRAGWLCFRHGLPHRFLPHQVPWRANAWALREVGVEALVVTSSVGVLDPEVPLFEPLLVEDLLWPDMRLPTGEVCTLAEDFHLVLDEGLVSAALNRQVRDLAGELPGVVFAYVPGPRTKTRAENRYLAQAGAQVNSMSVGPELVLANELELPCLALVVGHKHSHPEVPTVEGIAASLERSREAQVALVERLLRELEPVPFANRLFRF